jgi:hypothetical protein
MFASAMPFQYLQSSRLLVNRSSQLLKLFLPTLLCRRRLHWCWHLLRHSFPRARHVKRSKRQVPHCLLTIQAKHSWTLTWQPQVDKTYSVLIVGSDIRHVRKRPISEGGRLVEGRSTIQHARSLKEFYVGWQGNIFTHSSVYSSHRVSTLLESSVRYLLSVFIVVSALH